MNSYSHLAGAVLSAAGAVVLIVLAARLGDPWKVVSFSIYGAMLVALYGASTAYHSVRGRAKAVLQKLDHCSIYLLIAGSYTPFALVSLRGAWGWSLLGVVWGLALLGIAQEIWWARGARVLSLVIYVLMGWLALVAVVPLWQALTPAGFAWLAAGGAATRWASPFMPPTTGCGMVTGGGTCFCWAAAAATLSRCCSTWPDAARAAPGSRAQDKRCGRCLRPCACPGKEGFAPAPTDAAMQQGAHP